jgi:2,3-bisphosphoglycerate-independent phosphoglycerate mutase
MTQAKKTTALIILDGWGHRESQDSNAIAHANTPVLDNLYKTCTTTLISGSGLDVGLPPGQMGNSEVGHVNLGAGRVVYQDFTRVTKAIEDGDFFENPTLTANLDKLLLRVKRYMLWACCRLVVYTVTSIIFLPLLKWPPSAVLKRFIYMAS